MILDLKDNLDIKDTTEENEFTNRDSNSEQYKIFKTNLSAYIDNELPSEENIKIKKFTINNQNARKDLEESYHIRKLMHESMKKTENEAKIDFSKNILKQLEYEYEDESFCINPAIKILIFFTLTVLITTIIVISNLTV